MLRWKRKPQQSKDGAGDTLAELLASEQRLFLQLDAAKSEADRMLRDAHDHAQRAESGCATAIAARVAALDTEQERTLTEQLRVIEAAAKAEVARLDDVDEPRVRELATLVLRRVAGLDRATPREPVP